MTTDAAQPIKEPESPDSDNNPIIDDDSSEDGVRYFKARRRFLNVWTLIGSIVILAVIIYLMGILSIPIGIIIWTAVFVFVLRGPVNWLEKRGINRVLGTTLAYVLLAVVAGALGLLLFSPAFGLGEQFKDLVDSVPGYVEQLTQWYNQAYDRYAHFFQDDTVRNWLNQISSSLGTWASDTAKASAEGLVTIGGGVANIFLVVGFALVVAFWLLMDLPRLGRELKRLIGDKHKEDAQMLYLTLTRVMGGYIKATILQCLLIGLGCAIAYTIIGIPSAAALGGIAGVLNIIPVIGPWLGGGVAALVGVFISPWIALITVVVTILIQQFVYTFVSPKLMADSVDVHPAMVFIALFAGSALGGAMGGLMGSLLGMLASIPAVAAAKAIFVYYFEKKTGRRIVSEDGVFFKGSHKNDPITEIASVGKTAHQKQAGQTKRTLWQRLLRTNTPKTETKEDERIANTEKEENSEMQEETSSAADAKKQGELPKEG